MAAAEWFREQRFGMFIHMNIATVPAFAPVQEYADWYWAFWQDPPLEDIVLHPPAPFPEVRAFHDEHFPEIERFDDFIPLLGLERFDADAIVQLAADAGMRYVVPVTKHHDGYCWWDSSLTDRTSTKTAPRRDVIAELADATRAHDLTFGLYHSILDWSHADFPDTEKFVDGYLHPQVLELVDRFDPAVLWGDGHWGQAPYHWQAERLMEQCRSRLAQRGVELMANDRWGLPQPDFVTYEYDVPTTPPDTPWEMCRGMSHSFCFNRAETDDDHLTAHEIVDLLTEVVAKGGNFLLNIGPKADGTVPDVQARRLREAGAWVNANSDAIHGSEPFDVWGGGPIRYTRTPKSDDAPATVNVIDLDSSASLRLPHFSPGRYPIDDVVGATGWHQDEHGLQIDAPAPNTSELATVFRLRVRARERVTLAVVGTAAPGRVTIAETEHPTITAALAAAQPGDVVQLSPGRYGPDGEMFPLSIPAGVILQGHDATIDAGSLAFGTPAITLAGDGAVLEGVEVLGAPEPFFLLAAPAVTVNGCSGAAVRDCTVHGAVVVFGGTDVELSWNVVHRGNLASMSCQRVAITGNRQDGHRWGAGVEVNEGAGHRIDANVLDGDLCGVRVRRAADVAVSGNQCTTRWWGVELTDCTDGDVVGNRVVRAMRAVNIAGGSGTTVTGNVADRCDTGVLVELGSEATTVISNRLDGCRVAILRWNDESTTLDANTVTASRDHDLVKGP